MFTDKWTIAWVEQSVGKCLHNFPSLWTQNRYLEETQNNTQENFSMETFSTWVSKKNTGPVGLLNFHYNDNGITNLHP
jgi:hypothetical protein